MKIQNAVVLTTDNTHIHVSPDDVFSGNIVVNNPSKNDIDYILESLNKIKEQG